MGSFKYLGVHLMWGVNTKEPVKKKAQERLFFLQTLRKTGVLQTLLTNFYQCTIESVVMHGVVLQLHLRREERPAADHKDCTKDHRAPLPLMEPTLPGWRNRAEKIRSDLTPSPLQAQGHESTERRSEKQLLLEGCESSAESLSWTCTLHLHFTFYRHSVLFINLFFAPFLLLSFLLLFLIVVLLFNCCYFSCSIYLELHMLL